LEYTSMSHNGRNVRKTWARVTSEYRIVGLKFESCIGGDAFIPNRLELRR
jgi:hypothetical protein